MEMTRRHMFAATSAAAAMTSPHTALGGWEPSERYPDPAIKSLDPSFDQYRLSIGQRRAARAPAMRWCRRAGLVRRRPLPAVERHPEQPHPALGRGDRRGQRLPQALEQRQRQHARPPGPARHLRARRAARHAHRIRRHDHRADRPLRGQAAQLAERHRREVRRLDLVHRSAVRHPRQSTRANAHEPELPPTSIASIRQDGRGHGRRRRRRAARTASRSRPTRQMLYIVESRAEPRADLCVRRGRRTARKLANRRVLIDAEPRHAGRLPRRRGRQSVVRLGHGHGRARRRARCSIREGKPIGHIELPERCANRLLRRPQAQPAVHGGEPSLYALYVNTQGTPGN